MRRARSSRRAEPGFTLIEVMIAVVIVGVLAGIAVYAYTKHIKSSRMLEAEEMLAHIKMQEEAYRQRFGAYLSLPANPAYAHGFEARSWRPAPNEWAQLGLKPKKQAYYFSFRATAYRPGAGGDAKVSAMGMDTTVPLFYACATADTDSDAANPPMEICVNSQADTKYTYNAGQ